MAVADILRPRAVRPEVIPPDVKDRTDRGRKEMMRDAAKRRLCIRFERGDMYDFIDSKGVLNSMSTVTNPDNSGKPRHRIRNAYNHIRPLVEEKVSSSTQRIPGYEVVPSTTDPDDRSAAGVSQKVARYGYDKWNMRKVRTKVVKSAIAQGGDGFAYPYFDPDVGPYSLQDDPLGGEPKWVGRGEIRVETLGGNEVYWEPGVDFDDSPWYAIERARLIGAVEKEPGFIGGKLAADAATSEVPTEAGRTNGDQVMVTDYFERPCSTWPEGRRILMANGRVIVDYRKVDPETSMPWEPYPLRDHEGNILDEPVLHRLSYTVDGDSDRDLGLVWQLIDAQRTINDCLNKLLEWKNRCLNPQMKAAVGSMIDSPRDDPGWVNWYKPGMPIPEWEKPPPIPQELFQILNDMRESMKYIASYADAQAAPDVAAKSLQTAVEQSQARWASFIGDLAEFDSRLMRHCLMLVANFYDTPRLLKVKGWFGWDRVEDFTGSSLMGQVDVTVMPGSLTTLSRSERVNLIQFLAQNFPGQISMEASLAYIEGGEGDNLIRSHELDIAKIDRIIQAIRDGSVMDMPTRHEPDPTPDPMTGMPTGQPLMDPATGLPAEVPTYMPMEHVDNLGVWRQRLGDWMKTPDYEATEPGLQEVAKQIMSALQELEMREQRAQMEQQAAMAEGMGMGNAAKPAGPKPMPDQPSAT